METFHQDRRIKRPPENGTKNGRKFSFRSDGGYMSEGGGGTQIDGITDVRFRILKRGVIPLRVNGSETS